MDKIALRPNHQFWGGVIGGVCVAVQTLSSLFSAAGTGPAIRSVQSSTVRVRPSPRAALRPGVQCGSVAAGGSPRLRFAARAVGPLLRPAGLTADLRPVCCALRRPVTIDVVRCWRGFASLGRCEAGERGNAVCYRACRAAAECRDVCGARVSAFPALCWT